MRMKDDIIDMIDGKCHRLATSALVVRLDSGPRHTAARGKLVCVGNSP